MCGIVGIIRSNAQEYIESLCSSIIHRGPDDKGSFTENNLALGHTRLSIQDLSRNGHQPMISENKNYVLIFNGEIYNHWEIRNSLITTYSFKSTSDTETLLYAFAEYGTEVLNMLNGIFAFAIYDKGKQELVIARDQFGVKPLYFYQDKTSFLFGSEIKSFLSVPSFNKEISYEGLVNYLNYLWSPGETTAFKHVKKLLPGHYLKINLSNIEKATPVKYYDIPFTGKYSNNTEEELIDELDQKLTRAVKRQMLSDVPVGFFLSGGIDSSALVAIARKLYPDKPFQCFTIDTGEIEDTEGFSSDLYYAQLVAKHLNVTLEIVKADIDIVKDFDSMIYHLDEPQADPAPLNVLNICKKAREMGFKVLIGGTAGDDLFSGYRRHQALNYEKYFGLVPPIAGKLIKKTIRSLNAQNSGIRRARKLLANLDKSRKERMKGYFSWQDINSLKSLFSKNIQEEISHYNPLDFLDTSLANIPQESSFLNQMLYWEMKSFLPDHNLNYTDKMSMAVGVEVRVPFLDKELAEFSTRIPPQLKMKGTTTKYLLKKVMERYIPSEVIYRSKAGFGAPVRKWITNDLESLINEKLSSDKLKEKGIFDSIEVWSLINDNKSGKIDASYSIWCLLAIESWMRQFVDPK